MLAWWFALLVAQALASAVPGPLSALGPAELEKLCSATGGLAGPFGEAEIDRPIVENADWRGPTWSLGSPVGPFTTFQRWTENDSRAAHTLRYQAPTTEQVNREALARYLREIGPSAGWQPFTSDDPIVADIPVTAFSREVVVDGKTTTLWIIADGGLWTTSLYCLRDDFRQEPLRDMLERNARAIAARRRTGEQ